MDLQPERAGRLLHVLYLCLRSWIGRVYKQPDNSGCGYQIAQQPQSFRHQLGTQLGDACDVPTGPVQAGYEAEPDRVTGRIEDNGESSWLLPLPPMPQE